MSWTVAAPILGGILGGIGQGFMQRDNANRQMDFQEQMSNTAHTREVQDLRNAGLNPILSALGNGSSTPGGAMADTPDLSGALNSGINSAIAIRDQRKTFEQKDAQIANTKQDTTNKGSQTALIQNQAISTAKDIEAKSFQNKILKETIQAQIKKAKASGDYAEINQIMGLINSGASSASQLVNPLKILKGKD